MEPFYSHSGIEIFNCDVREGLKNLPEASAQCCITSPPYWGLRDYGTAEWEGGSAECDHVYNHGVQGSTGQRSDRTHTAQAVFKETCGKCGARRIDKQLGLEPTPEEYVRNMVEVFSDVRRVLRDDGTLWLNMGDSYANDGKWGGSTGRKHASSLHGSSVGRGKRNTGLKPKDLVGVPWMLAFALRADGWYLRSEIIWHKPNPMPESVTDRPTKAHEQIFLLAKSRDYHYDIDAIREPASGTAHARGSGVNPKSKWPSGWASEGSHHELTGRYRPKQNESFSAAVAGLVDQRNKRSVWTVNPHPFPEAHFATFPPELILPCVLAGCPAGGTVFDPFTGAGTTALVSKENGRRFIGTELKPEYCEIAVRRLSQEVRAF